LHRGSTPTPNQPPNAREPHPIQGRKQKKPHRPTQEQAGHSEKMLAMRIACGTRTYHLPICFGEGAGGLDKRTKKGDELVASGKSARRSRTASGTHATTDGRSTRNTAGGEGGGEMHASIKRIGLCLHLAGGWRVRAACEKQAVHVEQSCDCGCEGRGNLNTISVCTACEKSADKREHSRGDHHVCHAGSDDS
jgi:hypothetical protein